jgi:hypothetical protein
MYKAGLFNKKKKVIAQPVDNEFDEIYNLPVHQFPLSPICVPIPLPAPEFKIPIPTEPLPSHTELFDLAPPATYPKKYIISHVNTYNKEVKLGEIFPFKADLFSKSCKPRSIPKWLKNYISSSSNNFKLGTIFPFMADLFIKSCLSMSEECECIPLEKICHLSSYHYPFCSYFTFSIYD